MDLQERIKVFAGLGDILRNSLDGRSSVYTAQLNNLIDNQQFKNAWFTPENIRMAVRSIACELTYGNLVKWTNAYPELSQAFKPLRVAVIMAGNIPLAGFHDLLCVLLSGNSILAKTSSKDPDLIPFICSILCDMNPEFRSRIDLTEGIVSGYDCVIATGSDNSSRYFEYYFGKYPGIIRKNRNSVAIIEGNETEDELASLGTDIFSYFGLGCRNVSKIFIPLDYDFRMMTESWSRFSKLADHNKYGNNYDYHKAVFMVNREKFTDTGFLLIRESKSIPSPVAVLHFENHKSGEQVNAALESNKDKIQCIVGRKYVPFGKSQLPALWDYADKIDTIDFLLKKNSAGIL